MQEDEGGGREPDHGEGTQVPLVPRRLLVKLRAVGQISTSTKHAESLRAQIGVASMSVLCLNFSLAEQTFSGGGAKERLFPVQSGSCSPFKLSILKTLVVLQGLLHLRTNCNPGQSAAEEGMLFASLVMAFCVSLCVIDLISSVVVVPLYCGKCTV